MTVRVIAGEYKRKELTTPAGFETTRPTSDRVKESIFNILQNKIEDKCIVDLYAGSGALGIEGLSRGASKAIFVEINKEAITCIQKNLNSLSISKDRYDIYKMNVSDFLNLQDNKLHQSVDIIFADPPYNSGWYQNSLKHIEQSKICKNNCLLVLEMPQNIQINKEYEYNDWNQLISRKYGKTQIEIWRYESENF